MIFSWTFSLRPLHFLSAIRKLTKLSLSITLWSIYVYYIYVCHCVSLCCSKCEKQMFAITPRIFKNRLDFSKNRVHKLIIILHKNIKAQSICFQYEKYKFKMHFFFFLLLWGWIAPVCSNITPWKEIIKMGLLAFSNPP